jgi:hypothetical protein
VSVSVQARVRLDLDGVVYEPGQWIALPDEQLGRAQELLTYGLVALPPVAPVKTSRRRASP